MRIFVLTILLSASGMAAGPTLEGVRYGPHERNVLDFFKADSNAPAPVLIFFHGGGFTGGDKRSFHERAAQYVAAGISVVTANYRYSRQAVYPGPMLDGARVVQFVRSKAKEWNIDPAKVAVSGSSAGAAMALWIALRNDMADPAAGDPLARISTRVSCALVWSSTCSMDPEFLQKNMGVTEMGAMLRLFGVKTREELMQPENRKRALDASAIVHVTKDDPPLFLTYQGKLTATPLPPATKFSGWIHHPHLGELLKQKYDSVGLECHFYHPGKPEPEGAQVEFLKKAFEKGR